MKKRMTHAFTLAETLSALLLIGALFAITIINVSGILADNNTAKFKKGYNLLENSLSSLLNNQDIYGTYAGFRRLDSVYISNVGMMLGEKPNEKFRDCIKYSLSVVKDNMDCNLTKSSGDCFQTDDGIVWNIPDTDFVSEGVQISPKIKNEDGKDIDAVPITMILDYKDSNRSNDESAVTAYVTYDGRIYFKVPDSCTADSRMAQCNIEKYINATTIKIDNVQN